MCLHCPLSMTEPYRGMGIASVPDIHRDRLFLPRNDECIDYQGEWWNIGTGGANVPPFSLHLLNGVIAKEEE
jgi:hypothetical protein